MRERYLRDKFVPSNGTTPLIEFTMTRKLSVIYQDQSTYKTYRDNEFIGHLPGLSPRQISFDSESSELMRDFRLTAFCYLKMLKTLLITRTVKLIGFASPDKSVMYSKVYASKLIST